ncbi:MAG: site-specific integrase [Planctomycetes bacterium]|nr:site-specific integrase [Planctomycetota bacterium]
MSPSAHALATPEQLRAVELFAELTAEAVARRLAKAPPTPAEVDALLRTWLAQARSENTRRTYDQAVRRFAAWSGAAPVEAVARLFGGTRGKARLALLEWKAAMRAADLSPGTINTRVAAVQALVSFAADVDAIGWTVRVAPEPPELRRDTRGPTHPEVVRLFAYLETRLGTVAYRDMALARLLFDLALRVGEVLSLDVNHVDLAAGTVAVRSKGRRERLTLELPEPTKAALADWLLTRGPASGALFVGLTKHGTVRPGMRRMDRVDAARRLAAMGRAAGLPRPLRPHGLRHAAATHALDLFNGNVRLVARFTRHKKVAILLDHYDDARGESPASIARAVAGG